MPIWGKCLCGTKYCCRHIAWSEYFQYPFLGLTHRNSVSRQQFPCLFFGHDRNVMLGTQIQYLRLISIPCSVGACGHSSDFFGQVITVWRLEAVWTLEALHSKQVRARTPHFKLLPSGPCLLDSSWTTFQLRRKYEVSPARSHGPHSRKLWRDQ